VCVCVCVKRDVTDLTQLVFIDEASKNRASINRNYGWGPKRRSVYNKSFVLNGKRVSVLAAYNLDGFFAIEYTDGTFKQVSFNDWWVNVLEPNLTPYPGPNSVVVLDNARIHDRQFLFDRCQALGVVLLFLSTYSPDLNPIEKCWAVAKMYLKKHGGYHVGNDNNQMLLLEALDHVHLNMNHRGNFASCGWVMDPSDDKLDRWVELEYDE